MTITCRVCEEGQLVRLRKYRLGGVVAAIGYILLIPSVIGVVICGLAIGVTAFMMPSVKEATYKDVRVLISAGVPLPITEKVKLGQALSAMEEASLNPTQKEAVRLRQSAASSMNFAVGMASSVWILLGVMSFVSGLVGWLLVLKKDILQCHLCGAATPAS